MSNEPELEADYVGCWKVSVGMLVFLVLAWTAALLAVSAVVRAVF